MCSVPASTLAQALGACLPRGLLLKNTPREFVKAVVFLLWFYDLTIKTGLITWLSYFSRAKRPVGDATGNRTPVTGETVRYNNRYTMAPYIRKELARLMLHKVFVFP